MMETLSISLESSRKAPTKHAFRAGFKDNKICLSLQDNCVNISMLGSILMSGFLQIAVRPGHELTKEENAEFNKWLEKYNITHSNVFDVNQKGKFSILCFRLSKIQSCKPYQPVKS